MPKDVIKVLTYIYNGKLKLFSEEDYNHFKVIAAQLQLKTLPDNQPEDQKPKFQVNLTDLPPEILLKIFSHVPTTDLVKKVSLVSKQCKALIKNPRVHINVSLYLAHYSFGFLEFIKKSIFMKELRVKTSSLKGLKTEERSFQKETRVSTYYVSFKGEFLLLMEQHKHLEVLLIDDEEMLRISSGKIDLSYICFACLSLLFNMHFDHDALFTKFGNFAIFSILCSQFLI